MINIYTGTPGSGKSYHCTDLALKSIRRGTNVISTLFMDFSSVKDKRAIFEYVDIEDLTPKYLVEFAMKHHIKGKEGQTTVIVDEAQIIFNCRDWGSSNTKEWNSFFPVHRHMGFNFILATQDDRKLDKQIRGLIETEYLHRNMKHSALSVWLPYIPNIFLVLQRWYGVQGPAGKLGKSFIFPKKEYRKYYDTTALWSVVQAKYGFKHFKVFIYKKKFHRYLKRKKKRNALTPIEEYIFKNKQLKIYLYNKKYLKKYRSVA